MTADNPLDSPAAWRYISSTKGARWTVQKNFPSQIAQWPGYTVEPCYSAAALAAKDAALASSQEEIERLSKALEPFAELGSDEGNEDFPDDTGAVVKVGRVADFSLTLGDFRAAASALASKAGAA
jgi:hypothetical protein